MKFAQLAILGLLISAGCAPKVEPATEAQRVQNLDQEIVGGDVAKVEDLLKDGTLVNAPNAKGETPLHVAAQKEMITIAKVLIDHGANVNAKTLAGSTPLGYSISMGHGALMGLLLDHGANPDITAPGEWSALHVALGANDEKLVKTLLEKGASANQVDDGRPALYTAVLSSTPAIVNLLLAHGANPNAKTVESDETALFPAVPQGKSMVALLLSHGADINAKNRRGQTPLSSALSYSREPTAAKIFPHMKEAIALLRAKGAKAGA